MSTESALGSQTIMAFIGTTSADKARAFYRDTLGLKLLSEDGFALAFDVNGVMLRVTLVAKVTVAPYTVLGWQVPDIAASVKALVQAGVVFERFPGMDQDELGIWTAPGGNKVAWFKDPEGAILSLAQT